MYPCQFGVRGWFQSLSTPEQNLLIAVAVLLAGLLLGSLAAFFVRRILFASGVDEAVEGTPFERTARQLGSSTVQLLAQLSGLFVFVVAALYAARTIGLVPEEALVEAVGRFLPQLFVAIFIVLIGLVVADKAELVVDERLKSIKLPEVTIVSTLLKVSILYVAALVALSQLGVATGALLILLAAYAFGVFFLGGLAFKDLLSSAAAGIYLLLSEPYAIGDEIEIDGHRGIVQEMGVFVTHIERDGEEYILPNRKVFREGAIRIRGE
ncbi:mechanosensitive ion channel family protein [Natronomonas sp. F2-12]|jgi:small-conductance mechanosensitive channel|uniref:Mechanosensitive ion channel family protein n=1 Tax=Natronomonas aquatica TaxID=2841590 RepID=A0A9R1CSW2_9EURY|nr:mechanosensitive ion channel domain-containing protein [Natronomonas aquatica]MCQ4333392.1 mechanosensitive ion channel family protein [Natronomonas aquatica]